MLKGSGKTDWVKDSLDQIKLHSLMNITSGCPEIVIGLIDGPVDFRHPTFQDSRIRTVNESQHAACETAESIACMHGTFVAGMLFGKRETSALAICPDCEVVLRPVFKEDVRDNTSVPTCTPEELSTAIIETVNAGARIINLSVGLSGSPLIVYRELQEAYDYAQYNDVILVASSGNQGIIGYIPLLNHPWVIPVVACDGEGRPTPESNFGHSIGTRGLMAPGVNITSTSPGGQYTQMGGSSVAAPFVTGTIALLWSQFRKATASEIIYTILTASSHRRRTIIPPLLNAEAAWNSLNRAR